MPKTVQVHRVWQVLLNRACHGNVGVRNDYLQVRPQYTRAVRYGVERECERDRDMILLLESTICGGEQEQQR